MTTLSYTSRDEPWVSRYIYAERVKIVHASRMEADDAYDDLYGPVIEVLDALLACIAGEVDDDEWNACMEKVQAQVLFAAFRDDDRCDLFLGVSKAMSDLGMTSLDGAVEQGE
ncbi:hypothetical protein GQ57_37585 [Burkholderia sp. MSh2]|uniref:Uncharacterized protein n=1 Tax=Burkholderia paludis TaxID=1506587 RepID=A0A6J5F563_9BURK|nr:MULTISPECIES: hypothetical protein [Burkholderia]KEZ01010.1 hypothetical protein GQ57_37585 [Burkholderia sp. MSh2]CAB3773929.1 hypothetical protein LMG30113_07368 [Burkholderia paludis]VWC47332.1 hypothetical protein BPA30113_07419 [Burkholderia paludis]